MSARMIRRPATGTLQLTRNSLATARDFTSTCSNAEADKSSPSNNAPASSNPTIRRGAAVRRVQDVFDRSSNASNKTGGNKPTFTITREPVDGRSLRSTGPPGARRPAGPLLKTNTEQLKQRLRERASAGNRGRGNSLVSAASGLSSRFKRPTRDRQQARRRAFKPQEAEDEPISDALKAYQDELKAKKVRKPVRYNPEPYSVENLKETWPAFAGDGMSNTSTIREKLSWFGDSYVGGAELPEDLAKRYYKGKRVLFSSETQKAETMEFVKKMAKEHGEELTQRKGETVEPPSIEFENVDEKERSNMLATLVRGAYEDPAKLDPTMSPILQNVRKTLADNHTYHSQHTQRFMDSLMKNLPPLKKAKAKANAP